MNLMSFFIHRYLYEKEANLSKNEINKKSLIYSMLGDNMKMNPVLMHKIVSKTNDAASSKDPNCGTTEVADQLAQLVELTEKAIRALQEQQAHQLRLAEQASKVLKPAEIEENDQSQQEQQSSEV